MNASGAMKCESCLVEASSQKREVHTRRCVHVEYACAFFVCACGKLSMCRSLSATAEDAWHSY